MASGKIFTARVEGIAAGGAGIARLDGKIIFLPMTAGGDMVRCVVKKEHKAWLEGEVQEILDPSLLRAEPACPLYGRCGGCSLQHLAYEAQIEAKITILKDAFLRIGGLTPPEILVRRSAPYEYRNRFRFHRIDDKHLGLKEQKSNRVIPLSDCPIADSRIRKALKEASLLPPRGKNEFTVFSHLDTFLSEGGKERGQVSIMGKELVMDASVFFQSNVAMLERLIGDLSSAANRNLPLTDIYCGVGTFASFLGENAAEIELVEENKTALELARVNVPGKKLNYCNMTDTNWAYQKKNSAKLDGFMVLDPPREGMSEPLRELLALAGPEIAAYVSCNPATLARDSAVLAKGGYSLKTLTLYDFYPQTAHIESLALFVRSKK